MQSRVKKAEAGLRSLIQCVCLGLLLPINSAFAAHAKPAWQPEWEKTLKGAKKEGQVVVYISGYEAILPDFEREFPEIRSMRSPVAAISLGRACWRNAARKLSLIFRHRGQPQLSTI